MRALFALAALMLLVSMPARAEPPKLAVFDFELLDTSLQGEMRGPQADEHDRLMRISDQVRKAVDGIRQVPAPRHLSGEGCGRTAAICRPAVAATSSTRSASAPIWSSQG